MLGKQSYLLRLANYISYYTHFLIKNHGFEKTNNSKTYNKDHFT